MKRASWCLLAFLILFDWSGPFSGIVQAQQPPALVIEGGTLIDGNGGTPVRDALVIIQGNKITVVSRKGQVPYPANARIIKADGKYLLPGLWDSQVTTSWYQGEELLNHGVTSTIDVGNGYELAVPHRDAVFRGKIHGPRAFTGIAFIASNPGRRGTGLETPLTPSLVPKSAEDAREMVRIRVAAGADYIIFQDGGLPLEYYRAAFEEANKAGKPVFTRAYGPNLFPENAALLGSASLPHSAGIGAAVAKDTFMGGRDDSNELDRFAEMDDAKARKLIEVLVQHQTALVPTFMINFPGYPKDWARFEEEDRNLFSDPNLLAYYPAVRQALASYGRIDRGPVRERRMKGFPNALRFHKMFVDAGGRLVVSANTNDTKTPGLSLHHEMEIVSEAGIAPMQIIQGSTKWAAELVRKQDLLGTIESGKLADVVIVNEDPLQDIRNLKGIDTVIFDGKVVVRTYHAWFGTPFQIVAGDSPAVEGLNWVVALRQATFRGGPGGGGQAGRGVPDPVEAPQPAIETISPVIVTEGSPTTILTLKGFNFVRKTRIFFDGMSVPYQRVSPTEYQVTLDENLLRRVGRFAIVAKNPEPLETPEWGDGTSNKTYLIVNYKQ
ncbi:MAG: hypothetical protein A3J28_08300 [Acidobacteria bacterium RIFCSPLOWO2_12_FULL_60_22]|nr:MAG: hypothetical protein A3J28_08300 [Acidobacteria bacterium RIFCSPLOWO2_12_FULL_60_22]